MSTNFLILAGREKESSQVNPTRMKRVARKKRKRGGFTRVNACHLADAQSDLLLFLRNPTRFPIWDEKLVPPPSFYDPPRLPIQPSVSRRKSNSKFSFSLSLLPSFFPLSSSFTIPLCIRIFASTSEELFRIGDVTCSIPWKNYLSSFGSVRNRKILFPDFLRWRSQG